MTSTGSEARKEEKLGAGAYVLAGMSFIPLIGVVFGLIAIGRGIFTGRKGGKLLALIGAGGICFTIILYGSLFYFGFVQRGGIYDVLRAACPEQPQCPRQGRRVLQARAHRISR